jgi:hypothetical protein
MNPKIPYSCYAINIFCIKICLAFLLAIQIIPLLIANLNIIVQELLHHFKVQRILINFYDIYLKIIKNVN